MGHQPHPCQELHRQRDGSHGREAETVFLHHPGSPQTARLPGQCGPDRHSGPGSRVYRGVGACGPLGSRLRWARLPPGERLQIPPRPHPAGGYSLIAEEQRADVHLRIGRALLASMTPDELTEHLFDVANQFNRGAVRLIDRDEKAGVATLDLRTGRKPRRRRPMRRRARI